MHSESLHLHRSEPWARAAFAQRGHFSAACPMFAAALVLPQLHAYPQPPSSQRRPGSMHKISARLLVCGASHRHQTRTPIAPLGVYSCPERQPTRCWPARITPIGASTGLAHPVHCRWVLGHSILLGFRQAGGAVTRPLCQRDQLVNIWPRPRLDPTVVKVLQAVEDVIGPDPIDEDE